MTVPVSSLAQQAERVLRALDCRRGEDSRIGDDRASHVRAIKRRSRCNKLTQNLGKPDRWNPSHCCHVNPSNR